MTVTAKPGAGGDQQPVELITAVIDGKEVSVPKGTLIIRAAEEAGIHIPRFCDHPLLKPVGACRQCLVEVARPGRDGEMRTDPKPGPSCAMELSPGMEVKTQASSDMAAKAQEGVMEFLLINHPLDCPVCDKGGECPLQNQAMSDGAATSRFVDIKRTFPKPINISTQVLLDRERCILCQRCTRFSSEISGDPFIDLQKRGASQQVGTFSPDVLGFESVGPAMEADNGEPFASYFSGNVIQICPVGALTSAAYRFRSRPFDLISSDTVCEHCAGGCSLRADHRRGSVMRRLAGNDPEVNEEWNCDKGRFAFQWPTLDDRIETPLVRDVETGELRPASWVEATERAAAGLIAARDHQLDGAPAEATGVGVLIGGRHTLEDAYTYSKFARVGLGTNNIDFRNRNLSDEESEFIAANVAGRSLEESVTYREIEAAPNVLLIGLEPEEESASIWLRLFKGVTAGRTKVHTVAPFLTRGTKKLNASIVHAAPGTEPEIVRALATGHEEVADMAAAIAEPGTIVLVGERAADVTGLLSAVSALVEQTGARMQWIPRRAGDRAAIDTGAMPNLLPGARRLDDAQARADVAAAWGVDALPAEVGLNAAEIARAGANQELGALVLAGLDHRDAADPVLLLEAAAQTPFVVAMEVRHTVLTEVADVVFPVAPTAEKNGTYINFEGRYRPFDEVLDTGAMSDTRVLGQIANLMDVDLDIRDVAEARAEFSELGIWEGNRGPAPLVEADVPTQPAANQGVVATWHQLLDAGRLQDGEPHLAGTAKAAVARISAPMAARIGARHGDRINVSNSIGDVSVPLVVTDMPDGVVWLPATCAGTVLRQIGIGAGSLVDLAPVSNQNKVEGEDA